MDQKGIGMNANTSAEPLLKARGLVKRYGKVTALDHCDFDLMPGEILAVIGDNGAGKSSLIKALSGAVQPDEGEITLEGQPVKFASPLDARGYGIECVYQTLPCPLPCPSPTTCSWAANCASRGSWASGSASSTARRWRNSPARS